MFGCILGLYHVCARFVQRQAEGIGCAATISFCSKKPYLGFCLAIPNLKKKSRDPSHVLHTGQFAEEKTIGDKP